MAPLIERVGHRAAKPGKHAQHGFADLGPFNIKPRDFSVKASALPVQFRAIFFQLTLEVIFMKKQFFARLAVVQAAALAAAGAAHAELPASVSTAVTSYQTDALAALGLVLAAGVAIWGLRKLGQKMGWL